MVKTKHILIALAVIGANVLLNMPVHKAFAATSYNDWYGTIDGFVHTWPNPAVVSGVNLTIDDTTCNIDGEPKHADSVWLNIYGGYTTGNDTVSNNSLTIALNSIQVNAEIYAGYSYEGEACGNKLIINSGTINNDVYGGRSERGEASGNKLIINSGTINRFVYGGYSGYYSGPGSGKVSKNEVTINSGTITGEVYGGSSSVGEVSENKLFINNVTIVGNVYGGRTGDGVASKNEVTISNSTITGEVYGGYMGAFDDAIGNEVTIKNGTISNGPVSGGYSYMGNATNNSITIEGGTFNNVTLYGGSSAPASYGGDATDNSITIEGGTFNNVTLYGGSCGSGKTSSGNTLNLKTVINGTIKEVAKFQNVNFTIPAGMDREMLMLKVTTTPMELAGVTFNVQNWSDGDYITLVKGVNGTEGALAGHTNFYVLDIGGTKELVYANGMPTARADYTIKQGSKKYDSAATAGTYTDVNGNTTDGGLSNTRYSGNEVIIRRGTYSGQINGAAYSGAGTQAVSGNKVTVYDGSFDSSSQILGGFTGSGNANNNYITINAGSFDSNDIGAGYTDNGNSNGNTVIVNGGNFENYISDKGIWGGCSNSNGSTNENKVYINGGTFGDNISFWGGYNDHNGEANNNYVEINSGTFWDSGHIYSGYTGSGDVLNNKIIIKDGTFAGDSSGRMYFYGGGSLTSGNAKGNSIVIEKGTFGDKCYFEAGYAFSGDASDNYLIITDGTFGNDITFCGGFSGGGGTADNNIVEIAGGTFGNNFGLYGGYTDDTSTNNTLNLKIKMGGKAYKVNYFQTMNFTLPTNITNGDVMLKAEKLAVDYDDGTATINVYAADGVKLKAGDVITLVDASTGSIEDNYTVGTIFGVDATSVDPGVYSTTFAKIEKSGSIISLTMLEDCVWDVWYTIGSEEKILGSIAPAQTISNADGDVVLYHGAGENNEYGAITTAKSVTVGAETEIGKSFLVFGDLTAAEGVTVAAKNTLNIAADNLKSAVANSGTVALGEGILSEGKTISGGSVNIIGDVEANAGDIAGDTNTIAADKTLTLNGGTLADNITGDGNVTIGNGADAAEVTAALTKFGNTGDLTVNANGTLVTGGALSRDFKGTGTVQLNADTNLANGKKIQGTLDGNGKNVTIGDSSSNDIFNVGTLAGNIGLSIDVDLSDNSSDKLSIGAADGAVLNLVNINITNDVELPDPFNVPEQENDAYVLTYADGAGANSVTYNLSETEKDSVATSGGFVYEFAKGTAGTLKYKVKATDLTFKKFVEGDLQDVGTLSLTGDLESNGDIGTIEQGPNSITVNLNGYNLSSASESNIIVASGKILNLNGDGTVDGNTNFIVDGAMNITGETAVDGILAGAGTYTNSGTLNIADAGNLQMTNGLTNNGTLNLNGDGTLATGRTISGGTVNVNGNVTANADDIAGETNNVAEGKTLTLEDGTLGGNLSGTGSIVVAGTVASGKNIANNVAVDEEGTLTNSGTISGAVENAGTMTTTANGITGGVANSGILNLTGGDLGSAITGTGSTNILGEISSGKNIANNVTVDADGILTNSGSISGALANGGRVTNSGVVSGPLTNSGTFDNTNGALGGRVSNNAGGVMTTKLEGISNWGSGSVSNSGTLNIIGGGELNGQNITNTGTINMEGTFTVARDVIDNNGTGISINGGTVNVAASSVLDLGRLSKDDKGKTFTLYDFANATVAGEEGSWATLPDGTYTDKTCDVIFSRTLKQFTITNGVITLDAVGSNFVPMNSEEDGIRTTAYHVANAMAESVDGNITKFIDAISDMEGSSGTAAAAEAFNASMNIGEAGGVQHGAISMTGYIGEAIGTNMSIISRPILGETIRATVKNMANDGDVKDAKIEEIEVAKTNEIMPVAYQELRYEKTIWASYMHNKENINGLQLDGVKQNGTAQYNGTTVGADLWSSGKVIGGVAIAYSTGDVNSTIGQAQTKNEVKYYGVSVYNRWTNGMTGILADVGYMHSKNELTQHNVGSEATADAKINSFTAGVRAEQLVKLGRSNLVPFAGVRYMRLRNGEYTLSENGSNGRHFAPKNQNIITPQVGVAWNGEFTIPGSKWTFRPSVEVGYLWNLGDRDTESLVSFGGANDTIGYEVADKSSYFAKLGIDFRKGNLILGVSFKYQKGDTVTNKKWNINVNFSF